MTDAQRQIIAKLDQILAATGGGGGGGVTDVTGTAPIASSGGATPVISIAAATGGAPGSMSAADKTKLDALPGYLVYTALLTQTGTDAPSATVQGTPTIPGALSWTRAGAGSYRFLSDADPFGDEYKISVFVSGGAFIYFTWETDMAGRIVFTFNDIGGIAADALLTRTSIEIRLHP